MLCVHGNPTWSYLWRGLLAAPPPGWRVVAVDQLDMGFSERVDRVQRLADRVDDLGAVTDALGIDGPVVTVAHDWGGPISLGWARAHRDQLAGVVLTNTAVSQPAGSPVPALIALARTPGVLRALCVTTTGFLDGTLRLAHPALSDEVRAGFRAPYRSAGRRRAIGDFVADIPLRADHPTMAALESIADGLRDLVDVPALLLWGPRDPVFADRYLRDLAGRLPQAEVHRFEGAGHLLAQDVDVAGTLTAWLGSTPAVVAYGSGVTAPDPYARRAWARRRVRCGRLWWTAVRTTLRPSWSCPASSGRCRGGSWRRPAASSRPGWRPRAYGPATGSLCWCRPDRTSWPRSTPAGGSAPWSWSPTPAWGCAACPVPSAALRPQS